MSFRSLIALLLCTLPCALPTHASGLNTLFDLPVWQDENLWDDRARNTAHRLGLRGVRHSSGEFYRGEFQGQRQSMGSPLFAIDLYTRETQVQRITLGFINRADIHAIIEQSGGNAATTELLRGNFDRQLRTEHDRLRQRITQRLGQPSQGPAGSMVWNWVGHRITLQRGTDALTVSIERGEFSPTASARSQIYEPGAKLLPLPSYVKRSSDGDVFIDGIPPITQGNRNFCVPASWEKNLRHYGLSLDVYTLAQTGQTQVDGSYFIPFARLAERLLTPHGYRVTYPRGNPADIQFLKQYIDAGIPLIWGMDSQLLRQWVLRSAQRRAAPLPATPRFTSMEGTPAWHALLIVGYNSRVNEIALSDSTDLGHGMPLIWVPVDEIQLANAARRDNLVAINPPANRGASPRQGIRPRWY